MPGGLPPAKRAPLQPEKMAATIRLSPEQLHVLDRRSEEHTSELQSQSNLVCRLLLEKKKNVTHQIPTLSLHSLTIPGLTAPHLNTPSQHGLSTQCSHVERDSCLAIDLYHTDSIFSPL